MRDQDNREINYLRVSVTDRCNLRCSYCMPKEGVSVIGHNDILRYEEILRVVRSAMELGVVKVRVTGGEPLVRQGILDFLCALTSLEGLRDISLTTNGILLESMAEGIYRAGVRRINVSLDSLDPRKYEKLTRGGDLQRVLRGIETARAAGFAPLKINVVALKDFNEDEILEFARLTLEKPYQVRFIELMPFGRAGIDHGSHFMASETILEKISEFYSVQPMKTEKSELSGPARLYRIAGSAGMIGVISAVSHHFCGSCNRLRLTADGHLRSCLFSDTEVDLKTALRRGCSDSELVRLITKAISVKPRGFFDKREKKSIPAFSKDMSAIGG